MPTNVLGCHGAWVAVPASAVVFALAHGINAVMVVAFIDGIISALLLRTKSQRHATTALPAHLPRIRTAPINTDLYTTTMQMVPLLIIALFVDNRDEEEQRRTPRRRRWERAQDKAYALLAVAAFFTSMFVVSGVVRGSWFTTAIVIAALSGTMSLLLLQIWLRLDRRRQRSDVDAER